MACCGWLTITGTVVWQIIASQQQGPGFAYSIQVLQLLPQSIDMHVGLTGDSQLAIDVNVSMSGCLSV